MIALKLVFQSLAGAGAVIGVAGGGYYAYNLPNDYFLLVTASTTTDSSFTKDLFLTTDTQKPAQETSVPSTPPASSSSSSSSSNPPQSAIIAASTQININSLSFNDVQTPATVATTEENKKYECKSIGTDTKQITSSCDIYSLAFDTSKKTLLSSSIRIQIKTPNNLTKVSAKAELLPNNFFLLKASSGLYKDWTFDSKKTINLASTEETTKSFATLTVHARLDFEEEEGSTNFAIAKAISTTPATVASAEGAATTTYTCQLENKTKSSCLISLLTESSFDDLSFASINVPSTTPTLTFEANKYYLIKWNSPAKYSLKALKQQTLVVSEETSGTDATKKTFNFAIEAPVMVLPATESTTLKQVLIIK